jgi:hypothetical protein
MHQLQMARLVFVIADRFVLFVYFARKDAKPSEGKNDA